VEILATDRIIQHFCAVISCTMCDQWTSKKLLRDSAENVAQPGWVGRNYSQRRVLLVGQNPGIPPTHMQARDALYTAALRQLESTGSKEDYEKLHQVLQQFVPEWPVQRNYFPLEESRLGLEDIAYCNVVRCRTEGNATPSNSLVENCFEHFDSFVRTIEPKVVVFIGKWAFERAAHRLGGIPCAFMNRLRSLSAVERRENRNTVAELVRSMASLEFA